MVVLAGEQAVTGGGLAEFLVGAAVAEGVGDGEAGLAWGEFFAAVAVGVAFAELEPVEELGLEEDGEEHAAQAFGFAAEGDRGPGEVEVFG